MYLKSWNKNYISKKIIKIMNKWFNGNVKLQNYRMKRIRLKT